MKKKLLREIKELLEYRERFARPWDYDDIAWYCKVKKNTVINNYSRRDDFPRPVGVGSKRWRPDDIINWFNRRA